MKLWSYIFEIYNRIFLIMMQRSRQADQLAISLTALTMELPGFNDIDGIGF
jgi:hypothetical protein